MSEIIKVPMRIVQSMQQYQSRADTSLDPKTVEEYAERYRQGLQMDPIQVCGQKHLSLYITDGHHRFEGMKRAGFDPQKEIEVEVVDSRVLPQVVRWNAAGSNTKHGKPRTRADKQKAVEMALSDFPNESDETIAQHCDVDRKTVWNARERLGIPHPQGEQISAVQAAIVQQKSTPPPPPPTPPQPPEEDGEGRNDVVEFHNSVSSPEATPPPPPPPPATPPPPPSRPPLPKPPCQWPKPVEPACNQRLKDEMYRPIPNDLRDFYARRVEVMAVSKNLREIIATLRKGVQEHDPLWACVDAATLTSLESILKAVDECQPRYICPACSGMSPGCQLCAHRGGFIGKEQFENIVANDPELMSYMKRAARIDEHPQQQEPPAEVTAETP